MSATEIEQPAAGPYISFSPSSTVEETKKEEKPQVEQTPAADTTEEKVPSAEVVPEQMEEESPDKTLDFSSEPLPAPPVFQDKYKEREYLKNRLTLAFRVFAKMGFDCGIAGHITLRVSILRTNTQIQPADALCRIQSIQPRSGSIHLEGHGRRWKRKT